MGASDLRLIAVLLAAIASGCATMGSGSGSTPSGGSQTVFSWSSSGGVSGTITATTAGGQTYTGQYFQVTKETTVDNLGSVWYPGWGGPGGWAGRRGWGEWDYWDEGPSPDFITHYTGRVVANLASKSGTHMRCNFQLVHPSEGMNGGGIGQCQLPNGTTIDATFPTA
jgi:hypothetical protein